MPPAKGCHLTWDRFLQTLPVAMKTSNWFVSLFAFMVFIQFFGWAAFAQENSETTISNQEVGQQPTPTGDSNDVASLIKTPPPPDYDYPWSLTLDLGSLILKGIGGNVGWVMNDRTRVSVYAFQRQLKDNEKFEHAEYNLQNLGLRADYFFGGDVTAGGLYSAVAYDYGILDAEVNPDPIFNNLPILKQTEERHGPQAFLGYMFTGNKNKGGQFLFNIAFGYGVNGAVDVNSESTRAFWKSSFLLDLGLGFFF